MSNTDSLKSSTKTKNMRIELKGAGRHNKGAEMMLLTVLEQLRGEGRNFVYEPMALPGEYEFFSQLGLYPKAAMTVKNLRLDWVGNLLPNRVRDRFGLVADKEIDVVLDISGFAYSDQWGSWPTERMARNCVKWKKNGTRIILLPQAFGPFTTRKIKKDMELIISTADLIYARDDESYNSMKNIKNSSNIKQAADFTVLFKGILPDYFDNNIHQVCIVPNKRMIDKSNDSTAYINLLTQGIESLHRNSLSPYFLIHGGSEDYEIVELVNKRLDAPIKVVEETDPKKIKGLIEYSVGFVGSRFHGLASALYSGTVALGFGWSHKYKYLFNEMGYPKGLIDLNIQGPSFEDAISDIVNHSKRQEISNLLKVKSESHKIQTTKLFADIDKLLRSFE